MERGGANIWSQVGLTMTSAPFARTLNELVREQALAFPQATALVCTQGRFSYHDLAQRASKVAGALQAAGVKRGERVGLLLGNCVEWLDVCLGAGAVGATVVPLSTWSTRSELAFLLPDAKLSVLVASRRFGDHDFASSLAALQGTAGVPTADQIWLLGSGDTGLASYENLIKNAPKFEPLPSGQAASAGDDALVLYTSGSTSAPKAVPLRHFAVVENAFNIGERQGLTSQDRVLLSSPLFWAFGSANALPATFSHGATLVLMEKFDAALALQTIERERCTAIYTLPAMSAAMAHHPSYDKQKLTSLRTGVTIGSPEEFLFAVDKLGITELCNIYGATETCGNCAVTWHHWSLQRRAYCQGPPLPGQELRFVDEATGAVLPDGAPGLAEVRGYTTQGYSGTSAAQNSKSFTADGYYRTGDMGVLNADGDFVFVGRVSEMIKRAGINVSPAEIEAVLRRHPSVKEAAVVGVPDAARGERIFAYVVATPAFDFDAKVLLAHCATEASKYKMPDHIEACASLPLTVTGKLQRNELKQMAMKRALALATSTLSP
jgi:fatty-acyl-CoA synthase